MAEYTDTEDVSTVPSKLMKKEKEVLVIMDNGFFTHNTGDTYDGFFEVKKKDKSVKMHGPGTYKTNEGDSYTGIWENDKLGFGGEEVVISYHSGARYEGYLKDWNYHGKGKYTYPDSSVLSCEFHENCPVGQVTLTDPNGHQWICQAETGFAWVEPVNHYYSILEDVIDKAEIKKRRKEYNRSRQSPLKTPNKDQSRIVSAGSATSPGDQKKKVKVGLPKM